MVSSFSASAISIRAVLSSTAARMRLIVAIAPSSLVRSRITFSASLGSFHSAESSARAFSSSSLTTARS